MTAASPPSPMTARAERLATLVQVERRARAAESQRALAFHMVNDPRGLIDYRQALLWNAHTQRLDACSGLAALDPQTPFVVWLNRLCRRVQTEQKGPDAHEITAESLSGDDRDTFEQFFGGILIWQPVTDRDGRRLGALLLHRDTPVGAAEQALLSIVVEAYGHAWAAFAPRRRFQPAWSKSSRRLWLAATVAVLGLAVAPVPQSVLAPAEVVARDPAVLRAPVQGVVDRILVSPNQVVDAETPVVAMDTRDITSRLQSAHQDLAVAEAELRQARQRALREPDRAEDLAVLQGRRAQAAADVAFLQDTLSRMTLRTPRGGVVIYDDPETWIGRPVALGERILQVVAPDDAELDIRLPVADAIDLPPGTEVRLFLNSAPTAPVAAEVSRVGYRASPTPDGGMAYRVRAAFTKAETQSGSLPDPRVGLQGTAKLYGARTPLALYLLRRPLAAMRPYLGW